MTRDQRRAIDELANALQTAAPLSTELRQNLGGASEVALHLEAAIDRAVRAIRKLQPAEGGSR